MAKRLSKSERAALNSRMDAEWRKERKRIMDAGRKLKQRGFTLDADFVPAKKMKRHDQRILDSLKKFRGYELYKKVSFTAKGKTVHGKRAKAFQKEVKRQNTETPTIDPFANLKADLARMYAGLKDTLHKYDWGSKQMLFDIKAANNRSFAAIDVFGKIAEIESAIERKFASLENFEESQDYYNYLMDNMDDINASIQDAFDDSKGTRFLASCDKAVQLILQESPRQFDSEEYSDYGISSEDADYGEELPY